MKINVVYIPEVEKIVVLNIDRDFALVIDDCEHLKALPESHYCAICSEYLGQNLLDNSIL
jgi:hypothetical protein